MRLAPTRICDEGEDHVAALIGARAGEMFEEAHAWTNRPA
jgi:hypothetical protein